MKAKERTVLLQSKERIAFNGRDNLVNFVEGIKILIPRASVASKNSISFKCHLRKSFTEEKISSPCRQNWTLKVREPSPIMRDPRPPLVRSRDHRMIPVLHAGAATCIHTARLQHPIAGRMRCGLAHARGALADTFMRKCETCE